MHFVLQLKAE